MIRLGSRWHDGTCLLQLNPHAVCNRSLPPRTERGGSMYQLWSASLGMGACQWAMQLRTWASTWLPLMQR